jgi:hypothetical protein
MMYVVHTKHGSTQIIVSRMSHITHLCRSYAVNDGGHVAPRYSIHASEVNDAYGPSAGINGGLRMHETCDQSASLITICLLVERSTLDVL